MVFQFEDSVGKITEIERDFTAMSTEMVIPEMPDGEFPIDENQGSKTKWYIAGGIGVLLLVGGVIIYRRRKKKMNDSLDIDME